MIETRERLARSTNGTNEGAMRYTWGGEKIYEKIWNLYDQMNNAKTRKLRLHVKDMALSECRTAVGR